jgi:hypothetical protein
VRRLFSVFPYNSICCGCEQAGAAVNRFLLFTPDNLLKRRRLLHDKDENGAFWLKWLGRYKIGLKIGKDFTIIFLLQSQWRRNLTTGLFSENREKRRKRTRNVTKA